MSLTMLIERNGCFFDESELKNSHGYERLDPVGQETFVNHIHLDGPDRETSAMNIISGWKVEMKDKWPNVVFKIYLHRQNNEIIVRFHRHRSDIPDWADSGPDLSIITVG